MERPVTIVTGTGESLGTGHLQRMLSLAHFIRGMGHDIRICSNAPHKIPMELREFHSEYVEKSFFIIRDMRDSSQETVAELKKIAPVAVIDDLGPGRGLADIAIDLLPNLKYSYVSSPFIFGYNFSKSMEELPETIDKDIDVVCYLGALPGENIAELIVGSFENSLKYVFVHGHGEFSGNVPVAEGIGFAELMCRSRFVLTYFGITMFEALLCGCKVITVNPGKYHFDLARSVEDRFSLCGNYIYDSFGRHSMDEIISVINSAKGVLSVDRDNALGIIRDGLYKFIINLERGGFTWS